MTRGYTTAIEIHESNMREIKRLREENEAYNADACLVYNIALQLDSEAPDYPGAFTGTPSERISRQLLRLKTEIEDLKKDIETAASVAWDLEQRNIKLEQVRQAAHDVVLQEGRGRPSLGIATTSLIAMRNLSQALDAAKE